MLDTKSLAQLVEQHATDLISQHVEQLLSEPDWHTRLEQQVTRYIADRVSARFVNITEVPSIASAIESSITRMFQQGQVPGIEQFVDRDSITASVDQSVQKTVNDAIALLAVDQEWLTKVETLVTQNMVSRVMHRLSDLDINATVSAHINASVLQWQERMAQRFTAGGVVDQALSVELTVMDGAVVAENQFIANTVQAESDATVKGTLTVNNLAVTGSINTDNQSWTELASLVADRALESMTTQWQKQLVQEVLTISRTQGIEFDSVTVSGKPLLQGTALSPAIQTSDLRRVGDLDSLKVTGQTEVFGTLHVNLHRVGINTATPESALSVWDEEVCVSTGKLKQNHAWIGTSRKQNLSLGVNRTPYVTIDVDGLVTVNSLRVDRWQMSFAPEVPGWSGTRGDIVFNSDPKPDTPFAWVCLGSYRWQTLRAA